MNEGPVPKKIKELISHVEGHFIPTLGHPIPFSWTKHKVQAIEHNIAFSASPWMSIHLPSHKVVITSLWLEFRGIKIKSFIVYEGALSGEKKKKFHVH